MKADFIVKAFRDFRAVKSKQELDRMYTRYFGPKGVLNTEYEYISRMSSPSRKYQIRAFLKLRENLTSFIETRKDQLDGNNH